MPSMRGKAEYRGGVRLRTQFALRSFAVANPVDLKALLPQPGTQAIAEQGGRLQQAECAPKCPIENSCLSGSVAVVAVATGPRMRGVPCGLIRRLSLWRRLPLRPPPGDRGCHDQRGETPTGGSNTLARAPRFVPRHHRENQVFAMHQTARHYGDDVNDHECERPTRRSRVPSSGKCHSCVRGCCGVCRRFRHCAGTDRPRTPDGPHRGSTSCRRRSPPVGPERSGH
jgi:hypothetical protein